MYINIWDADTHAQRVAENRRAAESAESAHLRTSERRRAERAAELAAWESITNRL